MQLLLKSGSARGSPRHATSNLCVRFEELSRATCFSRKIRLLASFPIPGYNIKILTTSLELLSYWLFRCYYNSPFSSFSFFLSLIFFHYLFSRKKYSNILIFARHTRGERINWIVDYCWKCGRMDIISDIITRLLNYLLRIKIERHSTIFRK